MVSDFYPGALLVQVQDNYSSARSHSTRRLLVDSFSRVKIIDLHSQTRTINNLMGVFTLRLNWEVLSELETIILISNKSLESLCDIQTIKR